PDWTPNTTDFSHHRYAFGQQPQIGLWNLMMLAQALTVLVPDIEGLRAGLINYQQTLAETQHAMMLKKLGLTSQNEESDAALIEELHAALTEAGVDMTIFFRGLSHAAPELIDGTRDESELLAGVVAAASYEDTQNDEADLLQWLARYAERLRAEGAEPEAVRETMLAANPKYVLRNYLAQRAIEAAEAGDLAPLNRLMQVLKTPYAEQGEHEELADKRPEWARTRPGCATLSCSS
ncbi:MAG TPA: protein adenylyltransferase SelO family protein, partial [Abditibacteriaceae bacterium]